MTVKIEEISSVRKKISFEIASEKVDAEFDRALQKVAKTSKIKGFRPGKTPKALVEQHYGHQVYQQAMERLINESYFKALTEHRILPLADPEITEGEPLEKGKAYRFHAEIEVKPEVEAKDYVGFELDKERLEFSDKLVDDRLNELRQARAELKVSPRDEAAAGDFLTLDYEGRIDGELFDGGSAEGQVLELGSGTFIPGFEEQLAGMRRGDNREIEVTFPENYGSKELAGKPAVFRVTVHEIKEKIFPELNDELAREFGLDSLQQLRDKIADNLRRQEQGRIDGDLRERLMKALIARNPIEVPETMVARQLDYMLDNVRKRLQSQGIGLEMLGMNEEGFRNSYRETAVAQVQGSLLTEAVARQEEIRVEASEIDDKLKEIAEMANAPVEAVRSYYAGDEARRGLMAQILEEKTIQFLLDKSTVREVDKSELTGAEKETTA